MSEQKLSKPVVRTVRVRAEVVRQRRVQRGWTIAQLATKALVSEKTISSVERGADVFPTTLKKIAEAFGVEQATLIEGFEADVEKEPKGGKPQLKITIETTINFDDFDETQPLYLLLKLFADKFDMKGEIKVDDVRKGSVLIDLSFSRDDDLRSLVRALSRGELAELGIDKIRVPVGIDLADEIARCLSSPMPTHKLANQIRKQTKSGNIEHVGYPKGGRFLAEWKKGVGWTLSFVALPKPESLPPEPPPPLKVPDFKQVFDTPPATKVTAEDNDDQEESDSNF